MSSRIRPSRRASERSTVSLTDPVTVAVKRQGANHRVLFRADRDVNGADRLAVLRIWPGHPGGGHAEGSDQPLAHPVGHGRGHARVDRPVLVEHRLGYTEQGGLEVGRVADDAAPDGVGRPGDRGEPGYDEAAGQRFGGGDRLPGRPQQRDHLRGQHPRVVAHRTIFGHCAPPCGRVPCCPEATALGPPGAAGPRAGHSRPRSPASPRRRCPSRWGGRHRTAPAAGTG